MLDANSADQQGPLQASATHRLKAVHVISGDRWAGAEVQAFTLLSQLKTQLDLHVILMNEGELADRCRSAGIALTVLDENSLSAWRLFKSLIHELKQLRPDVVHTHRQKENILGSLANLLTHRARCLRTAHGAPEFTPTGKQRLQAWLDNFCGAYLQDGIIAVSNDLRTKLAGAFPGRKLCVIPNGIDPNEVNANLVTPDFKRSKPNAVHIGLVGRLEPVKRGDIFLGMAATLLTEKPDIPWSFHVFGDGSQEATLRQLANELSIDAKCHFHGHRKDIRSCIAGLSAVVMPSDHEGLPMTALESIALGIPLVAHCTGGLAELLNDDRDFLVTEHNANAYAATLYNVIKHRTPIKPLNPAYLASGNSAQVLALYQHDHINR